MIRIAKTIVDSGKLENYGTPPARAFLEKWSKEKYKRAPCGNDPSSQPLLPGGPGTSLPDGRSRRMLVFIDRVLPLLTRTGCNAGACHGAAAGRGALHLSLFGSDPATTIIRWCINLKVAEFTVSSRQEPAAAQAERVN